jgi:hypothetical protein
MIDDFRDFLEALNQQGARYVVVGAHALAAHGVPRTTGDLDVLVEATPENAARVWRALGAFGAPLHTLGVSESDFTRENVVAQFGLPPFRIDVLTGISGVTFTEAWTDRLSGQLFGVPVSYLGRSALIRNKTATGRSKDARDVSALDGKS